MSYKNRTYSSGSDKRKRKTAMDKLVQSQHGDTHKFLKSNNGASTASINQDDELAAVAIEEEQQPIGNSEYVQREENVDTNIGDDNVSGSDTMRLLNLFPN